MSFPSENISSDMDDTNRLACLMKKLGPDMTSWLNVSEIAFLFNSFIYSIKATSPQYI